MTMPAGKYYVGDLCYVMHDEWTEFCSITIPDNSDIIEQGEFSLKDGRRFAFSCTAYGDGVYEDQQGNRYGVDAGLIGCILLEDIREHLDNDVDMGNIVEFFEPFTVKFQDGVISFGEVVHIDTDPSYDDHEDEYDEEFAED